VAGAKMLDLASGHKFSDRRNIVQLFRISPNPMVRYFIFDYRRLGYTYVMPAFVI
jgi:hypothetical protein